MTTTTMTTTTTSSRPKESVLIVYVHGFKGTDVTFEQFPERLQHVVYESRRAAGLDSVVVSKVFPVFETKGELKVATDTFLEWLTNETVHLETATQSRAKVVLCGHSMGGLLIADAAIAIAHDGGKPGSTAPGKEEEENEKWPRIVALIAFDTPYLGLNPAVFKNGITKYAGHVEFAKNVVGGLGGLGLGGGAVWGMFGGAGTGGETETQRKDEKATEGNEKTTKARTTRNSSAAAANNVQATRPSKTPPPPPPPPPAATTPRWPLTTIPSLKTLATAASAAAILTTTAAAAYYKRDDLVGGWTWVTDHAVWLKNLWDSRGMRDRLSGIQEMREVGRVVFRNYYTLIPASPPSHPTERSFCLLPATTHPLHSSWRATTFSAKTEDEVGAHIGMFNAAANEGFYNLGLDVARAVEEALERDLDAEREKEEEEEADFLVG